MQNAANKGLQSTKDLLRNYDFIDRLQKRKKHVTEEHQDYGLRLAYALNDQKHKALYMKLAKEMPRNILNEALSFSIDYPLKHGFNSRGKIFMWKLTEICRERNVKIPPTKRKLTKKQQYLKQQMKLFK